MNKKDITQQALKQPESNPESGARSVASKKQLDQQEVPDKFHNGRPLPKTEEVKTLPLEGDGRAHYEAMEAQNNGNALVASNSREQLIAEGRAAINKRALGK